MSNTKEGINPLRPYHVPQPIIQHPIELPSNSTAPPAGASSSKSTKHGLGSSARDMLSDLDYSDYLSDASPSVLEIVKSLLDQGLWKYTSVLMAQPFDLAKVILQVQDAGSITGEEEERDKSKRGSRTKSRPYDLPSDDSDNDSQSYFTSTAPGPRSSRHSRLLALPDPTQSTFSSLPSPSSLARLDVLSSPSPLLSLLISVSASGFAGLILAPLDIARTKLLLTPITQAPRSILPAIRSLGSWIPPISIAPATFIHSTLPTLISASTPFILRTRLGIDPVITPTTYAAATLFSQAFELGIRIPVETVLRRGQMAIAKETSPPLASHSSKSPSTSLQTTVKVGAYKGLFGTMYHIVNEEGTRSESSPAANTLARSSGTSTGARPQLTPGRRKKGQGLEGLWRGWRVGVWGLVGIWGAGLVGGGPGGAAGEF
ncbi:mitochondrial fusion and transport protein ugo1 [Thelotrema lepadinum]|nr:mitochondrial fusion and transport protein ugo1 [Thelotrema lepadinum]